MVSSSTKSVTNKCPPGFPSYKPKRRNTLNKNGVKIHKECGNPSSPLYLLMSRNTPYIIQRMY
jgi:hypothetical protein